jgi:hypothetical protein
LPLIDYMLQKQNAIFETVELFDWGLFRSLNFKL